MGQFNATNDRQAQQFMAQIETQIRQYNAGYINATNQFNVQAQNAAEARDAQRITDVNKANAAIMNQVEQFNEQLNYNRQQWNAANEQAVINSNIDWRRRANTLILLHKMQSINKMLRMLFWADTSCTIFLMARVKSIR